MHPLVEIGCMGEAPSFPSYREMKSKPKAQTIRNTRMDGYPMVFCVCFSRLKLKRALAKKRRDEQISFSKCIPFSLGVSGSL